MTRVKLCGMMTVDDILNANAASPDMVGMILAPGFKRTVTVERGKEMIDALSPDIVSVGVFKDQSFSQVASMCDNIGIDVIQLHGLEDESYIAELQETLGMPVIKVFGTDSESLKRMETTCADMILVDPGTGSGMTFDLSLLSGIKRRFILAGGLTPDNVTDSIRKVRPLGVDTSSGIETDGKKDAVKMNDFVSAARSASNMDSGFQ